jgi:3-oxo-5-alpha-steroid 4-dehydrogenase 1
MTERAFDLLLYAWIALAIVLIPIQLMIAAPYGRHQSDRWGPQIGNRLGWIIMEIVSPTAFVLSLLWEKAPSSKTIWIIFVLWLVHYLHRSLIYPLRTRTSGKRIPVLIVSSAVTFNAFNGWSNGFYLSTPWATYPDDWLLDLRFVIGLIIFFTGAAINIWADNRLITLRKSGERGYVIPRGGLFESVSSPNLFGEIIEWIGYGILCWNLPAAAFAIWTAANLGPRAWKHHCWYRENFPDYPAERKALIPYIL